jgi:hypothetical protein
MRTAAVIAIVVAAGLVRLKADTTPEAQDARVPYGYGGYDGGYYDPYDPERSYPDPAAHDRIYKEGTLTLKVTPKDAGVYIDGHYAGIVDNFDADSRPVRIEAGAHRVELKDPRYETVTVTLKIGADRTTTYRAKMKKKKTK